MYQMFENIRGYGLSLALIALLVGGLSFAVGWLLPSPIEPLPIPLPIDLNEDVETLGTSHFDQVDVAGAATFQSTIDAQGAISDSGGALQLDDVDVVLGDISGAGNTTQIVLEDSSQTITMTTFELNASGVTDFFHKWTVSNKSSDYTVITEESGTYFTNKGASGNVTFTLPPAVKGKYYCFYVYESQNIYVDPQAGDQIFNLTDSAGDRILSNTSSSYVCLLGLDATYWLPVNSNVAWTDAN